MRTLLVRILGLLVVIGYLTHVRGECGFWKGVSLPPLIPDCAPCYKAAPCLGMVQRDGDGYPEVVPGAEDSCGCAEAGKPLAETCTGMFAKCAEAEPCLAPCFGITSIASKPTENSNAAAGASELLPLIIIPPVLGSTLVAHVDRAPANPLCMAKGSDAVWFDMSTMMMPGMIDCWREEMQLDLDVQASEKHGMEVSKEPAGVKVTTTGYGDPGQSLPKFPSMLESGGIWARVISEFKKVGYRENENLFAAPFDWRRGPSYWLEHDWKTLKAYVEKVVEEAGGKPAFFTSVSMGGPYFIAFLLHAKGVDAAWKKRHVAGFGMMSGPLTGTAVALGVAIWGSPVPKKATGHGQRMPTMDMDDKLGFGKMIRLKELTESWGSIAWMMPIQSEQHRKSVLIKMPKEWGGDITGAMLPDLLFRLSKKTGELYKLAQKFPLSAHPGVPISCMYGVGSSSIGGYGYNWNSTLDDSDDSHADNPNELLSKVAGVAGDFANGKKDNLGAGDLANLFGNAANIFEDSKKKQQTPSEIGRHSVLPASAKVGDKEWIAAAAQFIQQRQPDYVTLTPGDALVAEESLSACEAWTGEPRVKAYTMNTRHGSEITVPSHISHLVRFASKRFAYFSGKVQESQKQGEPKLPSTDRFQDSQNQGEPKLPSTDRFQDSQNQGEPKLPSTDRSQDSQKQGEPKLPSTDRCSILFEDVKMRPPYMPQCAPCYKAAPCFGLAQRPSDGYAVRPGVDGAVSMLPPGQCGCFKKGKDPKDTCKGPWKLCLKAKRCSQPCYGLPQDIFPDSAEEGATFDSSKTGPPEAGFPHARPGGRKSQPSAAKKSASQAWESHGTTGNSEAEPLVGVRDASKARRSHKRSKALYDSLGNLGPKASFGNAGVMLQRFASTFMPILLLVGLASCGLFFVCARQRQRALARLGAPADVLLEVGAGRSQVVQPTALEADCDEEASYEMLATPRGR